MTRRALRTTIVASLTGFAVMSPPVHAQDAARAIAECDRLAASDLDRGRPANVPGVAFFLIDTKAAIPACTSAAIAQPTNARLRFQLGHALAADKQYQRAFTELTEAARLGSLPATVSLGGLNRDGNGVPQNFEEARKQYEKAAKVGLPVAMFFLAQLNREGKGGPANDALADHWFKQARIAFSEDLKLGSISAMHIMGVMNEFGWGGPKDIGEARKLFTQAAAKGHPLSKQGLQRVGSQ